jgi:hypothetical protein
MADDPKTKTITVPTPSYDRIKAISEREDRTMVKVIDRMTDLYEITPQIQPAPPQQ